MEQVRVERAALIALLRRAQEPWPEIALDAQEADGAATLLRQRVGGADTLLPDDRLVDDLIQAAATDLTGWEAEGIGVHACFDDTYPAQLRDIREFPPLLFSRGTMAPDERAVAVVGSRAASERGLQIAATIAADLARRDITVVSGLATGIDTAAHRATLQAGGRTVAVIGTGIRRAYPADNRALQDHIARVGLVISQFWPDAEPTRHSFPMRNAIMSGYAAVTVVVEAGWRSGARIQARLALQHGRPVILTDQVMVHDWARTFAEHPGVHVVTGTGHLLEVVETILARTPPNVALESFPDLAVC
jgi:DNA processing protein